MSGIANKGNVLLVDDSEMTRSLLRLILVCDGYRVIGESNNGDAGLEMSLRLKPDIVCLDVQMPKSDGLTVLRKIRTAVPTMTVIMITSSAERETVQAAISGGAAGYIVKPFNSGRVLAVIEGAMKRLGSNR
ncbi:response regulator [Propionivibrio sp.]|uniref:response regulator n=1 Tax=Propionivibrio sp. TaxID=2212460 RepID=UPI003BF2A36B